MTRIAAAGNARYSTFRSFWCGGSSFWRRAFSAFVRQTFDAFAVRERARRRTRVPGFHRTLLRGMPSFPTRANPTPIFGGSQRPRTMIILAHRQRKLRGGGPIPHNSMKALAFAGPCHLEPSSAIPHRGPDRAETAKLLRTYIQWLVFITPGAWRHLGNHPLARQPPQRNQQVAGQCYNHGLAGFR
jgi:hypothetical protein